MEKAPVDRQNARPLTQVLPNETVVDVRTTPPAQRHPRIFGTFEALSPGESFVLLNDHDPKPLYYQFQAEHTGRFTWDYLEKGPESWRVRIRKLSVASDRSPIPTVQ